MPRLVALVLLLLVTRVALGGEATWVLERRMVAGPNAGSPLFAASLAGGPAGVLAGVPAQSAGHAVLFDDATGGVVTWLEAPVASREFGRAVAVTAHTLAVAAPDAGSVFLFDAQTGVVSQTLRDPHAGGDAAEFGRALALGPSDVVVGAPFDDHDGADAGAAWVFDRRRGTPRFALIPPIARPGAHFGTAVAIAGDDVVVGASGEGASGTPGSVTLYSLRTGAVRWSRSAPPSTAGRLFGFAVAAGGRHVAVGAPCRDGGSSAGLVVVLERATGKPLYELTAPAPEQCDFFGGAVALGAGTIVVGARLAGDPDTGAVHVFAASTGRPLASFGGGGAAARLGWSVATRGSRVLAGAAGADGDVRVYRRARD